MSGDPRREARLIAMAYAGQQAAVQWGHEPWSDSWALLVAERMLEAQEDVNRTLESAA